MPMGKCEHPDDKGEKRRVERMGPEDPWASGGGGAPRGRGALRGGPGSGPGPPWGNAEDIVGF